MFGGQGVYGDGRIVAVVLSGELLLEIGRGDHVALRDRRLSALDPCARGACARHDPSHKLPDEALDDPDVMPERARLAMEASERAASAKPNTRASQGRHADNLRVDNRETAGDPL